MGDAAGPWRYPSARHKFLLTVGFWLVQISDVRTGSEELGSFHSSWGGQAAVELRPPCPKVGMKDMVKGPPSSPRRESP